MSTKPSILFDTEDWPVELRRLNLKLRFRCMRKVLFHGTLWTIGVFAFAFGVIWMSGVTTIQGQWGRLGYAIFVGLLTVVAQAFTLLSTRRKRLEVSREVLLAHGYCPCGYRYVEQGVIRSCPECGRQWTVKQPPRE